MDPLPRKITVSPKIEVSSLWAVPDSYRAHPDTALVIAHGAGNDMNAPIFDHLAGGIADQGVMTVRFNFPYKEAGKKLPDRAPVLEATWRAAIDAVREDPALKPKRLFLSGKSMGGRMATHLAAQGAPCAGVILFGYPLHAPNKSDTLRADQLNHICCPLLFIQGSRDALCRLELLRPILDHLTAPVQLYTIEGGDHSFKVPKRAGRTETDVWDEVVRTCVAWMDAVRDQSP